MKKFFTVLAVGLLIAALSVPALAWDFSLNGTYEWTYQYFDQTGKAGFFGAHDAPQQNTGATTPNYTSMNFWSGARWLNGKQFGLVTGQDASISYTRMELFPEFRINPAIRIRGKYSIGSRESLNAATQGGFPVDSHQVAINSDYYGSDRTFADGQWSQLWATVQLPWGILVYGKREAPFGLGLQYDGATAQSESFALVAPYGPLRIGAYWYPWRPANFVNDLCTPFTVSNTQTNSRYPKQWDKDGIRSDYVGGFFTYESGDLSAGAIYEHFTMHQGPQASTMVGPSAGPTPSNFQQQTFTADATYEDGGAFLKYNNGRFFFNTEVDWLRGERHLQQPVNQGAATTGAGQYGLPTGYVARPDGAVANAWAPYDNEAWKFMVELGAICGPTKLSLQYTWTPGPDRRQGLWINKQSWENVAAGLFLGSTRVFKPYSFLMSYQYGGGLNALNASGEGFMTDAETYGARLDYAVAANLNTYVSGFYANRLSHGWGWGTLVPTPGSNVGVWGLVNQNGLPFALTGATTGGEAGSTVAPLTYARPNVTMAPSIPDNNLGYEIDAGVDWKMLEGFTVNLLFAYWQPGNWFKYACVDKRFVSSDSYVNVGGSATSPNFFMLPAAGDGVAFGGPGWGINPDRSIDPVLSVNGTMMIDF